MWESRYDSTLRARYYYEVETGEISFDLPCEVNHKTKKRPKLLSKITSALSLKKLTSAEKKSCTPMPQNSSTLPLDNTQNEVITDTPTSPLLPSPDFRSYKSAASNLSLNSAISVSTAPESYLLQNDHVPHLHADASSLSSGESIHTFYLNLAHSEIIYDDDSIPYYEPLMTDLNNFDRDQERLELRQQILSELF